MKDLCPWYIVKIKKGIKPYGGRKFIGRETAPYYPNGRITWEIDIKSRVRDAKTYAKNCQKWMYRFSDYADYREYDKDEIEVIKMIRRQS